MREASRFVLRHNDGGGGDDPIYARTMLLSLCHGTRIVTTPHIEKQNMTPSIRILCSACHRPTPIQREEDTATAADIMRIGYA